ncbi:50S ribosomal protein L32 [Micromonospora sp. B11E3]|uniref:50S ribosomal protein L32 n=1 Tax=Micromonospora sp. B11E3 TaxID=3153562 RepID=UPI00325CBDF2
MPDVRLTARPGPGPPFVVPAGWKAQVAQLTPCPCPRKEMVVPHRACTHCGLYKGRQVVDQP